MQKFTTRLSSRHKQLTRIRYGWNLHNARLLSTWIIIQLIDDRVSSLIGNIMEHYLCRHGRNPPPLDYELYGDLLSRSCTKNIWNFAHEYGISLPTSPNQLDIHREGELFLMEQFSHSRFMPRKLKKINRCQLYLQPLPPIWHLQWAWHLIWQKVLWCQLRKLFQATHSWSYQGYPGPKC